MIRVRAPLMRMQYGLRFFAHMLMADLDSSVSLRSRYLVSDLVAHCLCGSGSA